MTPPFEPRTRVTPPCFREPAVRYLLMPREKVGRFWLFPVSQTDWGGHSRPPFWRSDDCFREYFGAKMRRRAEKRSFVCSKDNFGLKRAAGARKNRVFGCYQGGVGLKMRRRRRRFCYHLGMSGVEKLTLREWFCAAGAPDFWHF